MCESGISFVSLEDASYPKRLRHIANPPYGLYVKGCLPQGETVAIVGARMCSEYGRTVARELGRMLAARGVGVVSGMRAASMLRGIREHLTWAESAAPS